MFGFENLFNEGHESLYFHREMFGRHIISFLDFQSPLYLILFLSQLDTILCRGFFIMKIGFALPQKQENHKTSLCFHYFPCYHYQELIQKFLKGCELLTCAQFFLRTPLYQIHSNVFERFAYNFIFYSKDAPLILFSFYSYKLNNRRSLFTYILQTILTIFSNIQPYAFKWSL